MVLKPKEFDSPVFIFGVCGRCSSTALQRILNSSNQICIWGEQHFLIEDILEVINRVELFMEDSLVQEDIRNIHFCYERNKHFVYYCNAIGNLTPIREALVDAIISGLKPLSPNIPRFGFKDIRIRSESSLVLLKKIFPNSKFVFLFRSPIPQWKSVNHYKYWDYSHNVNLFLDEYQRISNIYLEYNENDKDSFFLENSDFDNPEIFGEILSFLSISEIDERILNTKMYTKYNVQQGNNINHILKHDAYGFFKKMQKRSKSNLRHIRRVNLINLS